MATPLNQFKTKTYTIQTKDTTDAFKARGTDVVYTVPQGVSAIILMAQISNIANDDTYTVNFVHHDVGTDTSTYLVKDFGIQSFDAASPLTGKLVVQEGNQISIWASASGKLELTLSYLESLNG
tara:strand:- start:1946 stop:2317 length:372 start_codon:yes stop_codon:yes gene_type:complete